MTPDSVSDANTEAVQKGLQWSAGGWFGSLFGYTLWMVLAGCAVLVEDIVLAVGVFASVAAVVLYAWRQWGRREDVRAGTAHLSLLVAVGIVATGLIAVFHLRGRLHLLGTTPTQSYLALLVIPIVFVLLWRKDRAG